MSESTRDLNQQVFGTETPVALVTGSLSKRVGRCIAEQFRKAGFQIVLHGRQTQSAEDLPEGLADLLLYGQVEEESTVMRWVEEVKDRCGRFDLMVNSAAVWDPLPLEKNTAKDFVHQFEVNALGTALSCRHFGLMMSQQPRGGCILNIGDWATVRPYRDFAAYFTSKGAIQTITQTMAVELALRNPNVRVNAVLPGPVLLTQEADDELRERIRLQSLLQREGRAEDVAQAAVFLAQAQFITGVCLPVDGGRSIYSGPATDALAHPSLPPSQSETID